MPLQGPDHIDVSPPGPGRIQTWALHALAIALALSLGANIWLARRVSALGKVGVRTLEAGAEVPPFSATEWRGGRDQTISYAAASRPTVLYVFSPACVWCERNLANVKALVAQRGESYRFLGLSLSRQGLEEHAPTLPFPVYADLSAETIEQYRLGPTPQTIVVSPSGRVLGSWRGAYTGPTKDAVEKYFEAALPGVLPHLAGS